MPQETNEPIIIVTGKGVSVSAHFSFSYRRKHTADRRVAFRFLLSLPVFRSCPRRAPNRFVAQFFAILFPAHGPISPVLFFVLFCVLLFCVMRWHRTC